MVPDKNYQFWGSISGNSSWENSDASDLRIISPGLILVSLGAEETLWFITPPCGGGQF